MLTPHVQRYLDYCEAVERTKQDLFLKTVEPLKEKFPLIERRLNEVIKNDFSHIQFNGETEHDYIRVRPFSEKDNDWYFKGVEIYREFHKGFVIVDSMYHHGCGIAVAWNPMDTYFIQSKTDLDKPNSYMVVKPNYFEHLDYDDYQHILLLLSTVIDSIEGNEENKSA